MINALPTMAWFDQGMAEHADQVKKSRRENVDAIRQAMELVAQSGEDVTPDKVEGILDQFRTTDSWLNNTLPTRSIIDGMAKRANQQAEMQRSQQTLARLEAQQKEQQIVGSIVQQIGYDADLEKVRDGMVKVFGDQNGTTLFAKWAPMIPKIQMEEKTKRASNVINTWGNMVNSADQVDQLVKSGMLTKADAEILKPHAQMKEGTTIQGIAKRYYDPMFAERMKTNSEEERSAIAAEFKTTYGRDIDPGTLNNIMAAAQTNAKQALAWHEKTKQERMAELAAQQAPHMLTARANILATQLNDASNKLNRYVMMPGFDPKNPPPEAVALSNSIGAMRQELSKMGGVAGVAGGNELADLSNAHNFAVNQRVQADMMNFVNDVKEGKFGASQFGAVRLITEGSSKKIMSADGKATTVAKAVLDGLKDDGLAIPKGTEASIAKDILDMEKQVAKPEEAVAQIRAAIAQKYRLDEFRSTIVRANLGMTPPANQAPAAKKQPERAVDPGYPEKKTTMSTARDVNTAGVPMLERGMYQRIGKAIQAGIATPEEISWFNERKRLSDEWIAAYGG